MSKLKDLSLAFLNAKNAEINEIVGLKTKAAEQFIRDKVVIPYCKKHGYRFSAGMGGWCFHDRDGDCFYPGEDRHKRPGRPHRSCDPKYDEDEWYLDITDEDREVRDILSFTFENQRCCIGAYMEDYKL